MIKKIKHSMLAIGCLIMLFSCKKEIAIESQKFGKINLNNQTTNLSPLALSFEGGTLSAAEGITKNIKLPAGQGKLSIKDNKGNLLIDTLIDITENSLRNLVLFKPSEDSKAIFLENNQEQEPKPNAGFAKIKIANLAPHCFPGNVDLLMRMYDFNYGDLVDMDIITQITPKFGDYGIYKTFDTSMSDGNIICYIIDPITKEPLHSSYAGIIDINDPNTGKFYNVFTFYITEQLADASSANMTGTDGKLYLVETKALFLN
ncbi:hypothetical protein D3C87_306830 [compost metagenome]